MCGHGTIGVVATLAHLGRIGAGTHRIDTPVGIVTALLHPDGEVAVTNVPSFRKAKALTIEVPGIGAVTGDVAWGGNWFFLVADHGQELTLGNVEALTDYCWRVRQALNAPGPSGRRSRRALRPAGPPSANARNFVLCPGKAYDRSPCGTGTSAKLACLAADGKLQEGDAWVQESILGSTFTATIPLARSRGVEDRAGDRRQGVRQRRSDAAAGRSRSVRARHRLGRRRGRSSMGRRVVIVGGGVVGLCTAYYCVRRGFA